MSRKSVSIALIALTAVAALIALIPQSASAAVNFTQRYSTNAHGNIILRGNTQLKCPASADGCLEARQGNGTYLDNNNYDMQYWDIDSDISTFNSTEARASIPSGATVLKAYLYWAADTSVGNGTTGNPAPEPNKRNQVRLKTPTASTYTTLFADQVYREDRNRSRFQSVKDVTALVSAAGSGVYRVANIQSSTGDYSWAGWSLVIVYKLDSEPVRNLTVFDGLAEIGKAGELQRLDVNVSGFRTPTSGPVRGDIGTVIYDGDLSDNETGDSVRLNGTKLSNAVNPPNNYANSTISEDGALLGNKNPNIINQMGIDVDRLNTTNILNNSQTSATFRFETSKDIVLPGVFTFAFEMQAPSVNLTKSVTDLDGGDVEPGDTLRYTVNATNNGNDPAIGTTLIDPIPDNSTYDPGSLRVVSGPNSGPKTDAQGDDQAFYQPSGPATAFYLGTGATASSGGTLSVGQSTSISFDVVVDPGAVSGTEIRNQAYAFYSGQSTPSIPYSSISNEVVNIVALGDIDLTIDKTASESNLSPGESFTYTLTPSNVGSDPTTGEITVTDVIDPSIEANSVSGTGWDCDLVNFSGTIIAVCTTSDVVAPGDPLPPITINATVRDTAVDGDIVNTGVVSGGGDSNPNNNEDTATITVAQNADMQITKTASDKLLKVGEKFNYSLVVRNNGPSVAHNVIVRDDPPKSIKVLSVSASKGSCSKEVYCEISTMTRGEEVRIQIHAKATKEGKGIRNTANVGADEPDSNPNNNEDSEIVTVERPDNPGGGVDLSIHKSVDEQAVRKGDKVTFTMVVENLSKSKTATGVVMSDQLPKQLKAKTGKIDVNGLGARCSVTDDQRVRCEIERMGPGERFKLSVEAELVDDSTDVKNVAKVKGDQPDPNPDNNTSSVVVFTPENPGQGGGTPSSGGGSPSGGPDLPFTGLPLYPALIAAALLFAAGIGIRRRYSR